MTLDLTILIAIGGFAVPVGFVCYWLGVAKAERRAKAREAELMDDLDFATALLSVPAKTALYLVRGGA